nr:CheR family methyltransferase [Geomonas oryzisoli]
MPQSAISAGLADIVAPPHHLPGKIAAYLLHSLQLPRREQQLDHKEESALDKVLILLRSRTGHDFSMYKKSTLYRRIERRMGIHQVDKIANYARYLQESPQEVQLLFNELLIGVTNFFRDQASWTQLRDEVIPLLLKRFPNGGALRAWSVGCSTGEEAYSLAIIFKEALERLKPDANYSLQIFATDLDVNAIDKARLGRFQPNISADVSADRLRRFFIEVDNGYQVTKDIRDMITFATQNVIMDPPFTKLDILVCRNLLIYLVPELQKKLFPLFHYSINPGGVLFLGSAETIGNFSDIFTPVQGKSRLYWRGEALLGTEPVAFPSSFVAPLPSPNKETEMQKSPVNLQSLVDQLILQQYAPPAVLVTDQGDIVYINGRTGKYLEPAMGRANWNVFAMARDGLRFELTSAFQKALRQQAPVMVKGAKVGTNGSTQLVDLIVQRIENPDALRGMAMIIFKDVPPVPELKKPRGVKSGSASDARITELEQELQQRRDEISSFREEMQSSQEELKSMNEELQSTNEELQSTNEELTTSKEEMQSMNEELQAVNAEQQAKVDELSRMSSDMKNLLDSTEVITVFLDTDLHVRLYTKGAQQLFKLIPSDVGRPLSDIVSQLDYPDLLKDAKKVLETLTPYEHKAPAGEGSWFSVRIKPYRNLDNITNGVVITFSDITVEKCLEQQLEENHRQVCTLMNGMPHGFALLEADAKAPGSVERYRFHPANPGFEKLLGVQGAALSGKRLEDVLPLLAPVVGEALVSGCRSVIESGRIQVQEVKTDEPQLDLHLNIYPVSPTKIACMAVNLAPIRTSRD